MDIGLRKRFAQKHIAGRNDELVDLQIGEIAIKGQFHEFDCGGARDHGRDPLGADLCGRRDLVGAGLQQFLFSRPLFGSAR